MIINQYDIDKLQEALNRELNNRAELHVLMRDETDLTRDEKIAQYKKKHARSVTINVPLTPSGQIDYKELRYN